MIFLVCVCVGGGGIGRVLEPKQYARLSNEVKYKKVEKGAQSSQYFTACSKVNQVS